MCNPFLSLFVMHCVRILYISNDFTHVFWSLLLLRPEKWQEMKSWLSTRCEKLQKQPTQLSPVPALALVPYAFKATNLDPVVQGSGSTLPSVPVDIGNSTVANRKAKSRNVSKGERKSGPGKGKGVLLKLSSDHRATELSLLTAPLTVSPGKELVRD